MDPKQLADQVVFVVRTFVEAATVKLMSRIEQVERAYIELPKPKDGTSVTVEDVRPLLEELVKALPPAKDGKDGTSIAPETVADMVANAVKALPPAKDGASVTVEDVRPMLEGMVKALPPPINGKDGKDGTSVTVEDVRPMLEGMVKALPPAKDGTSVTVEDVRPLLEELVKALPPAADGKDALDIDVLDMDEFKSYPRGTYVAARGGLLKAFRKTDPLDEFKGSLERHGWAVAMNGIDRIEENAISERTTIRKTFMTSGQVVETAFKSAAVLYRNVFAERTVYEKADAVTYGGSVWIATKDAPEGKPGTSGDWKLMVKRGKDGNDGRDGIDKTATVKGGAQ